MNVRKDVILDLSGNKITSDRFKKAVDSFLEIIEDVSKELVADRDTIQWIISVEKGSALVAARPESISGNKDFEVSSITAINEGLAKLERGISKQPRYFTQKTLRAVRHLAEVIDPEGEYVDKVRIRCNGSPISISTRSLATVDSLLAVAYESIGSVEGRIETVTERGGLKFNVYDTLTDKAIRCFVGEELLKQVLDSFGKRVSVSGLVKYGKDGFPKSISAKNIRTMRDKKELPTVDDMQGILTR